MAGWRTVVVTTGAKLKLLHGNLHLEGEDRQLTLPIEDLDAVLIESPRATVSVPVLRELARRGATVLVVDDTHTPCGVFLPFAQNPRTTALLNEQIELSQPFKKRAWQAIVQQKIRNQAACLDLLEKPGGDLLRAIARDVKSGDSTNREGLAAREYFRRLHLSFKRRAEGPTQGALNYGYAIVRSAVARSLVATGLHPALGVGHVNKLNPFNLADDFVEVFRPFVDLLVFSRLPEELDTDYKHHLLRVLQLACEMTRGTFSVRSGATEMAESYARAVQARDPRRLDLPRLASFDLKEYE